jgi:hypothetical protein
MSTSEPFVLEVRVRRPGGNPSNPSWWYMPRLYSGYAACPPQNGTGMGGQSFFEQLYAVHDKLQKEGS